MKKDFTFLFIVAMVIAFSFNLNSLTGKASAPGETAAEQEERGDVYRKKGNYEQALKHHLDALRIEEKIGEQARIAVLLNKIGNDYLRLNRCEDALANFQRALKIRRATGEKPGIAETLNNIGIVYYELSQYHRALKYFRETLQIKKTIGNKESIALSLNNIGLIYDLTGDYGKAIENHLQALQIQEEIGDKVGISRSLNNIGVIYMNLKNNEKALEYYKKAIIIEEELGNPINLSIIYNNIGIIHRRANRFDQALKNYQKALQLVEGTGHKSGISRTLVNIGITYDELNQPQHAVKYFKKSLQINEEIDNKKGAAVDLFNLGASYLSIKNYAAAAAHLARALKIARDLDVKDLVRDCYENLSTLYGEQGNHKKALEYYKLYVQQKDAILNQETSTRIAELQTRYDTEKKEKKIILLEKDNELLKKNSEIQKLTLSKERLKANAFIVGFILVMIIALLILKKYLHFFAFWKKRNYIGHYKIIDRIGAGGMGVIYKAVHVMKDSEPVAVKVIREEFARDEIQRRRFLNESLLVDQLNHPHIVKVYERGEYNQQLYIAMEILEGPSLAEIIRRGEMLPLPDCLSIMGQLAATVARVHARGIVHRDLKPDNIVLIDREGNRNFVKLLDFGLARHHSLTRLTGTGEILGTINYLPPEQISRQEYSPASDIYSLGVVFYELLTLEQPFIGDFPVDIIKQILDKDPLEPLRFRPGLNPEINRLIMQMMNKSPEQRPTEEFVLKTLDVSSQGGPG